jgi:hypothetical protein
MKKSELKQIIKEEIQKLLNENISKIIDNFEQGLMVYIMDAYQRLDNNKAELLELNELYDSINWFLKNTPEEEFVEYEKENLESFINNRSQIEHYLIDNINEPTKVQWPGLPDVFYYTPLVKKNQIWIKLGTTPNSKLNPKYDYYNPSEDLEFPIRIKNKDDFEKYSKELEAKGYYWYGEKPLSSFNPAEQTNGIGYPFRLLRIDKNSKQLGYN